MEARFTLIDDGKLIEFSIDGDITQRFRQTVSAQVFLDQQLTTITRFLSRYGERKKRLSCMPHAGLDNKKEERARDARVTPPLESERRDAGASSLHFLSSMWCRCRDE